MSSRKRGKTAQKTEALLFDRPVVITVRRCELSVTGGSVPFKTPGVSRLKRASPIPYPFVIEKISSLETPKLFPSTL